METKKRDYYLHRIRYGGIVYTFVTQRNFVQQKRWFDKIHKTCCNYRDIISEKIKPSIWTHQIEL